MDTSQPDARYPQWPPFESPETIKAFLERPLLARLSTHNADGTIHMAPVYFLYADGAFMLASQLASRKVRNIQKNSKVTLLIDTDDPVLRSVMVYGRANLDLDDVVKKRAAIFAKYDYTEAEAHATAERMERVWGTAIIRVIPDKFVSVDYSRSFKIE